MIHQLKLFHQGNNIKKYDSISNRIYERCNISPFFCIINQTRLKNSPAYQILADLIENYRR